MSDKRMLHAELSVTRDLVNRGGRIGYAYVEVDHRLRAEPADVLAAVRGLQP